METPEQNIELVVAAAKDRIHRAFAKEGYTVAGRIHDETIYAWGGSRAKDHIELAENRAKARIELAEKEAGKIK